MSFGWRILPRCNVWMPRLKLIAREVVYAVTGLIPAFAPERLGRDRLRSDGRFSIQMDNCSVTGTSVCGAASRRR
jgi:hypothetical protein